MSMDSAPLFQPFRLGQIEVSNRIVMAPLTRNRAMEPNTVPSPLAPLYYTQRAAAGLIVSEATQISQQGQGYAWTPGIFNDAQIEGWRAVTKSVHAAGGKIVCQIWHVGRVSHTSLQPGGGAPVAPSAIAAKTKTFIPTGFADTSAPRALETHEIAGVLADYAHAARCAERAGFDGVEIHAANGYLIDQFLRDGTNKRTDLYGGSVENRIRFALEVTDAILKVLPAGRVGIRLSPASPANDALESNPSAVFFPLVAELGKRKLAYAHIIEGATQGARDNIPFDFVELRKTFGGPYIANNGYTRDMAIEAVSSGKVDMVAFGRPFISNPDLVERLRIGAPLAEGDRKTYYGGGAPGYTDYPTLSAA
jgi:N-ethylmaleimide reductase